MYYIELDSAAYNRKSSETQWLKYRRSLFLFLMETSGSRQLRPGMKALRSQAQNWGSSQLPAPPSSIQFASQPWVGVGAGLLCPCVPCCRPGLVWHGLVPGSQETEPVGMQLPVRMKWKISLKHCDDQFHLLTWLNMHMVPRYLVKHSLDVAVEVFCRCG